MLSVKSRFRLNIWRRKLAIALGAMLASGALVIYQAPQATAAPANFKVTDKIPDANPCKKDDAARHDALKKAVKAVLSSKLVEKINENIEAAVKGKGVSIATEVDVELAPNWQTYQKIFSEASGDKLTDGGAQSDFGTTAVISRDASKNGHKLIKTVFFCNNQLQDAFTQKNLPRAFVRALAHAEARAITFTGIAKGDLPAGYSTGDDGQQNGKAGEHVDALLKLVPANGNGKKTAKTAEAPAPVKPAGAPKAEITIKAEVPKAPVKAAEASKPPVKVAEAPKPPVKVAETPAKDAKAPVAETKKKDETKKLAETQPLSADKAGAKKAEAAKAKPAKDSAGSMTTIKKNPDQKAAGADAAKASDKGPKLKAKARTKAKAKVKRRHHVSHRHHKRHVIKHKRRHRQYHDVCPFSFFW
jgi:outer membrane biosynthesis protein TonB